MLFAGAGDFFIFLWTLAGSLRFSGPRLADCIEMTLAAFRLGWRPVVAVTIPFGMAFGFNFDSLLGAIGARSFAGGSIGPSMIRQAGPLVTSMIVTAVVGAAFAADLGARKVRDEIAASEVMAVNPLPRLVIPRVLATMIATPFLYVLGAAAGILGGFVLLVMVRSANVGSFVNGLNQLVQVRDIVIAMAKSAFFGILIGTVSCFFGLKAEGGPAGVASKVRLAIITSTVAIFVADFAITSVLYVN